MAASTCCKLHLRTEFPNNGFLPQLPKLYPQLFDSDSIAQILLFNEDL